MPEKSQIHCKTDARYTARETSDTLPYHTARRSDTHTEVRVDVYAPPDAKTEIRNGTTTMTGPGAGFGFVTGPQY